MTHSLARGGFALAILLVLSACTSLPTRPPLPPEAALPLGTSTPIDRDTSAEEERHPNQSAFRVAIDGVEAFATRARTARMAGRSLDVQTYIWHSDLTGLYLAHVLLEAADRGVKVRLLVDDLDARAKNMGLAALSAHPNIDVRLFNPFASRSGTFRKLREGVKSFDRINRRMHNKSWIADNRIALAGGRNLGDEYFGANEETNFVDLEFVMVGPVVRDVSASFDTYWNFAMTYPVELLDPDSVNTAALDEVRKKLVANARETEKSHYAKALASNESIKQLLSGGEWPAEWVSDYKFVADAPSKITKEQTASMTTEVSAALDPLLASMSQGTRIISPYFVPGEPFTNELVKYASSGKAVRILTNSLVANDVAAVHGGYATYRKQLLAGGVELWELKPIGGAAAEKKESDEAGGSGASLHAKGFSIDERFVFIGSYNLDPRSTWLNCEQGVLVTSPALAKQFAGIFTEQTAGANAWQVTLSDKKDLSWTDGKETFDEEPHATRWLRFQAWFARVFNLEAQL